MASNNFIISFLFCFFVVVSDVACKQKQNSCGLFEYYDKHMDDCGPCQEICDLMKVRGTEKQCKSQCSHYLVAVTCTYTQYYDDVVSSCAPCSELCDLSDVKGTTEECARRCPNYLKAQNCRAEKEYFDDTVMECSDCSQLCSQQDKHGDTNRDCFIKCHAYIEGHPLGNILKGDSPKDPSHAKSRTDPAKDDTASMHPGIILSLVIGLIVVAVTIIFVYWVKNRHPAYTPAPSIEANLDEEEKSDDIEQARHAEDSNTESLAMQHAATPSSISVGRQEGDNINGNGFAIQEQDPKATGGYSFSQVLLTRETVL